MSKSNLTQGTIYLTISSAVFMISGYIINVWLGKHLGPQGYGIYGVVISLMNAFTVMQTSGLPQATSKFIAEDETRSSAVLRSSLTIQMISTLGISAVFYFGASFISSLFQDPALESYIRLSSLVFPVYGLFVLYTGYYNGRHEFGKQAVMYIIYSIAKAIGIILLVIYFGIFGAVIGFIVSPLAALLYGFTFPRGQGNFPYKKMILFTLPLLAFAVVSTFQLSLDLFLVKSLMGNQDATGLYTAAQNVARIPYYILGAFSLVVFPAVSRSVSARSEETRNIIRQSFRFALMLLVPLTALIIGSKDQILNLLYSQAYLSAGPALAWLLTSTGLFTLFFIAANVLNGAGKPYLSVAYSMVGTAVAVILCFTLIPQYGLVGAAIATGIGCLLSLIGATASIAYYFGAGASFSSVFKILLASAGVYIAAGYLPKSAYIELPVYYTAIGAAYLALLMALREFKKEDWAFIVQKIPWLQKYES